MLWSETMLVGRAVRSEIDRYDAIPGANHMRGMQYQMVLNLTFHTEIK